MDIDESTMGCTVHTQRLQNIGCFANQFPNLVPKRSIQTKNKSILGRQDGWMDGKNTSVHTSIACSGSTTTNLHLKSKWIKYQRFQYGEIKICYKNNN